jgi:hypothetical protein
MTDIEIRNQQAALVPDQTTPSIDLRVWAEQATAAAVYAEAICRTSMVPSAYKGKPEEAAAAILAGSELGLSPMASLRAFDNISGTPAPKAMTLRAVVQAAGHEVVIEESTNERAVVSGRRKGSDTWQTSVWDVARAQQLAQFKSNPNYRTNLAQMLVARATAEACRWIGADALMGMPYAAEEIEDQPALAPSPVARRLTVADLDEPPAAIEAREEADGLVTDKQRGEMFALWTELGYSKSEEDRRKRLWLTAQILGLDETLESSNDLTRAEADRVIAALRERKERTAGGEG